MVPTVPPGRLLSGSLREMLAPREARKRLGLSPQEAPGPEGATGWSVCQGKEHIWRDSCAAQHQSTASVQDCTDLCTADKH
ncbi:hypothetical protein CapIbe_021164 [Capra ibex]